MVVTTGCLAMTKRPYFCLFRYVFFLVGVYCVVCVLILFIFMFCLFIFFVSRLYSFFLKCRWYPAGAYSIMEI